MVVYAKSISHTLVVYIKTLHQMNPVTLNYLPKPEGKKHNRKVIVVVNHVLSVYDNWLNTLMQD